MSGNRRSGRRRIPTVIKRTRGSAITHDTNREPTAPVGMPARPAYLDHDPAASAYFDALGASFLSQRILTTAHGGQLAILASGCAQYDRLQVAFADDGFRSVIKQEWKDEHGRTRERWIDNPLCRQIRQQATLLNTLFGEFGQTPASAPKVVTQPGASDPFEDFLSRGPAKVEPFRKRRA